MANLDNAIYTNENDPNILLEITLENLKVIETQNSATPDLEKIRNFGNVFYVVIEKIFLEVKKIVVCKIIIHDRSFIEATFVEIFLFDVAGEIGLVVEN